MSDEGRKPPAHQDDQSEGTPGTAEQMRAAADHYLRLLNIRHEAIICIDEQGGIVAFNQGAERLFGHSHDDVIGTGAWELLCEHFRAAQRHRLNTLARIARENRFGFSADRMVCKRGNDERFPAEIAMSQTSIDGLRLFTLTVRDISERLQRERQLTYQAEHDTLTDLPNRALLEDRLQAGIARADRYNRKLAVVFIDLDNFKPVNDRYGHEVGDCLLKALASRFQDTVRQTDTVCRIGGDEFIISLEQIDTREDALAATGKLISALGQPFRILGVKIQVTASIGIALYPEDGRDPETLLRHADQAMYTAKEKRSSPQFFYPLREERDNDS